jgi:putative ABC transport system permease protein
LKLAVPVVFAGFVLMSAAILRSWDSAVMLLGSLAATTSMVWVCAALILRLIRGLAYKPQLRSAVRYGLRSLYRPASRTRALIVAVGAGLSTIVGTFETHRFVASAIVDSLPFDHANLLVAAFDDTQSRGLPAALRSLPGAEGEPETLSLAWLRLGKVDGAPFSDLATRSRIVPHDWLTGCEAGPPRGGAIISATTAKLIGAKVGSSLEFYGGSEPIEVNVVAVRSFDPIQEIWHSVTLNCQSLNGQRVFHHAAIRVRPDQDSAAALVLRQRYPGLAVITAEDLASTVSTLTRQTEGLVRLLAWYTLAAGVSVLIAIVMASRAARRDEIATLRALGAGRKWIVEAYLCEYAAIGLLAGLVSGLLSGGFESLLLWTIFRRPAMVFQPGVLGLSMVAAAIGTAGAAWLPLRPLMKQTPMEMLRRLKGT